jgi:hypothetical protein
MIFYICDLSYLFRIMSVGWLKAYSAFEDTNLSFLKLEYVRITLTGSVSRNNDHSHIISP